MLLLAKAKGFGIWLWQIIDLLATDKSQYFAQPRPIIVKYYTPNAWSLSISSATAFPYNECLNKTKGSVIEYNSKCLVLALYLTSQYQH